MSNDNKIIEVYSNIFLACLSKIKCLRKSIQSNVSKNWKSFQLLDSSIYRKIAVTYLHFDTTNRYLYIEQLWWLFFALIQNSSWIKLPITWWQHNAPKFIIDMLEIGNSFKPQNKYDILGSHWYHLYIIFLPCNVIRSILDYIH